MKRSSDVLTATDFLPADGKRDVSGAIQQLIDENPNRTLYFPDGTYRLAEPIVTPAEPSRAVSLHLADFAVFKAAPEWNSPHAMVRLGAKFPANNIHVPGSNYRLAGGIIDGSGIAAAVAIESGRETVISDVVIKNAALGIHIMRGANNGSSDADIRQVCMTGNGSPESVGLLIEGWDNTFTNLRIAHVHTGVIVRSNGNNFRNIHPLYTGRGNDGSSYDSGIGFRDEAGSNWYDYCYSDQFAVGFKTFGGACSIYNHCFCFWYRAQGTRQISFEADGKFNSVLTDFRVGFHAEQPQTRKMVLRTSEPGGCGSLERLIVNSESGESDQYAVYLNGKRLLIP